MIRPQTLAAAFVACYQARESCVSPGNEEWRERWRTRLEKLVDLIPSGSGIDQGPRHASDLEISPRLISFAISFHHMDEHGFYSGWTEHKIDVIPTFSGIDVKISGRNRNDVKDHLYEAFEYAFTRHVTWNESRGAWDMESDDDRYAAMARAYPEVK